MIHEDGDQEAMETNLAGAVETAGYCFFILPLILNITES